VLIAINGRDVTDHAFEEVMSELHEAVHKGSHTIRWVERVSE
jgi:hypothetical protein